jgi:large subunit ribosomal protein L13Ae
LEWIICVVFLWNLVKYFSFLRKRTNTNPTRGPWHYRAPSRILWRVVRGMIPHKTERGKAALERLKVFEGIPHPFDRLKRECVPAALKSLRLKPGRKFCRLGDLATHVGWKHDNLISKLETTRKTKSAAYYTTKKQLNKLRTQATKNVAAKVDPINKQLQAFGY